MRIQCKVFGVVMMVLGQLLRIEFYSEVANQVIFSQPEKPRHQILQGEIYFSGFLIAWKLPPGAQL